MADVIKTFVIGDPHFKERNYIEDEEFVEKTIACVKEAQPDIIVILGDTLDTHEVVRIQPHNLACQFIERLSKIAHVYVLIGNHDLIDQTQFLSQKHIFGPLKKWKNVTIVDEPIYVERDACSFVFCPYVPPGRFLEALDKITMSGENWEFADCVFAHQEFYGCKFGAMKSEVGDKYSEDYPPVISGHIHEAQVLGENVFYPGSSRQHTYGEDPRKHMWIVTFGEHDEPPYFTYEKVDIGMKKKKIVHIDVENINDFDTKILEKYDVKLSVNGTSEQFKNFRKSKTYTTLRQLNVKFTYNPVASTSTEMVGEARKRKDVSYINILNELVKNSKEPVRTTFNKIFEGEVHEDETISEEGDDGDNESSSEEDTTENSSEDVEVTSEEDEVELIFHSSSDESDEE